MNQPIESMVVQQVISDTLLYQRMNGSAFYDMLSSFCRLMGARASRECVFRGFYPITATEVSVNNAPMVRGVVIKAKILLGDLEKLREIDPRFFSMSDNKVEDYFMYVVSSAITNEVDKIIKLRNAVRSMMDGRIAETAMWKPTIVPEPLLLEDKRPESQKKRKEIKWRIIERGIR